MGGGGGGSNVCDGGAGGLDRSNVNHCLTRAGSLTSLSNGAAGICREDANFCSRLCLGDVSVRLLRYGLLELALVMFASLNPFEGLLGADNAPAPAAEESRSRGLGDAYLLGGDGGNGDGYSCDVSMIVWLDFWSAYSRLRLVTEYWLLCLLVPLSRLPREV